jgi:hypothetical protein
MEIVQSKLAKIAGMNRQAIYNAVRRGQLVINSAQLIDTENKTNLDWLQQHGISQQTIEQRLNENQPVQRKVRQYREPSNPASEIRKKILEKSDPVEPGEISDPVKIIQLEKYFENPQAVEMDEAQFEDLTGLPAKAMQMTLMELVLKLGGPLMLEDWSKIAQRFIAASFQNQKMQEHRTELCEKDFFISNVSNYINILHESLFDLAESQTEIIIATIKSNEENARNIIKDMRLKSYSKVIKEAQHQIESAVRRLRGKHEKDEINIESNE